MLVLICHQASLKKSLHSYKRPFCLVQNETLNLNTQKPLLSCARFNDKTKIACRMFGTLLQTLGEIPSGFYFIYWGSNYVLARVALGKGRGTQLCDCLT